MRENLNQIHINELDSIFDIYSSNLYYEKSILDPNLIQALIDIYDIEKFEIAIKGNYIYLKFWIEGLFSNPPLEKEIYDRQIIYKNYKILYSIFYLISKLEEKL